jgi:hypothetical protein
MKSFLPIFAFLLASLILARAGAPPAPAASSTSPAAPAPAAKKPVDVYLVAGQSNATGQGYLRNLPPGFTPDARVLLFNSGRPHLNSGAAPLTWVPLRQASESPDRFGPELGFGNRLQELEPAAAIALIKHAHSGTNLYAQWAPGGNATDTAHWGPQFKVFVQTVDAGLQGLRAQGYAPVIRGMIWQQGENDAFSGNLATTNATVIAAFVHAVSDQYGTNLAHFIQRVREQFSSPDMLFVYGYVLPPPNNPPGRDAVRRGERAVDQNSGDPLAVPGAFVVATDDLPHRATDPGTRYPQDDLHFSTNGTLDLGRRMAETMDAHRLTPAHPHLPAPSPTSSTPPAAPAIATPPAGSAPRS